MQADSPTKDNSASPTSTSSTPTIRYGDLVLYESALINDFIEEQFPERPLLPRDPGARARDRLWVYHCDHMLMPALAQLLAADGATAKEQAGSALHAALRQIINWGFRPSMPAPFWHGASIGLVDLAYQTFFQAVQYVQGMKDGPDIALDAPLEAWRRAIADHPCVRKAHDVARAVPYADEVETR